MQALDLVGSNITLNYPFPGDQDHVRLLSMIVIVASMMSSLFSRPDDFGSAKQVLKEIDRISSKSSDLILFPGLFTFDIHNRLQVTRSLHIDNLPGNFDSWYHIIDMIDNAPDIVDPIFIGRNKFFSRSEIGNAFGAPSSEIDQDLPAVTRLNGLPTLSSFSSNLAIGSFNACLSCWESNGLNNVFLRYLIKNYFIEAWEKFIKRGRDRFIIRGAANGRKLDDSCFKNQARFDSTFVSINLYFIAIIYAIY